MSNKSVLLRELLDALDVVIPAIRDLPHRSYEPFKHWPETDIRWLANAARGLGRHSVPLRITDKALLVGGPSGYESVHNYLYYPDDEAEPPKIVPFKRTAVENALDVLEVWRRWAKRELGISEGWLRVTQAAREVGLPVSQVTRLANRGTVESSGRGRERRVNETSLRAYVQKKHDEDFKIDKRFESRLRNAGDAGDCNVAQPSP